MSELIDNPGAIFDGPDGPQVGNPFISEEAIDNPGGIFNGAVANPEAHGSTTPFEEAVGLASSVGGAALSAMLPGDIWTDYLAEATYKDVFAQPGRSLSAKQLGEMKSENTVSTMGMLASGAQANFEMGKSFANLLEGDRDAGLQCGTEAVLHAAHMIPGVGQALGKVDMGLGIGSGLVNKLVGGDGKKVMGSSLGEIAGNNMVMMANALLGADEDTGDLTRREEIGAGLSAMTGPIGLALGSVLGFDGLGDLAGDFLGINPDERSHSGSGKTSASAAATAGQGIHALFGSLFD